MSTATDNDQDKRNPGAKGYRDDFERDFGNRPTLDEGVASPEGAIDQAKARLSKGEAAVEPPRGGTDTRPVPQREASPAGVGNPPAAPPTTGQMNPAPGGSPLRRRRGVIGLVLIIVSLLLGLAGFNVLLPFKVPGYIDSSADEAGQRVRDAAERKATLILARAMLADIGSGEGVIVTGNGPVSSLIATMKTNKFEADLAKRGLVIQPTEGGVRLIVNDKPLAQGQVFKDANALNDAIYADNITFRMVKQIVREEIPVWRWMKRAQIAKFIKLRYGVKRFGIKNSENPDPDKAVQEMQQARLTEAYERTAIDTQDAINCIMAEDDCELKDGEKNISDSNAADVAKDVDEAGKEVAATAGKTLRTQMQSLTGLLQKILITKIGTKLIPIVGWIDLVATADHIAYNALNDDYFTKIPAYFRERAYAQTYADWQGYGDQIKPGEMNGYMVGALSDQLNGAETSCAHNYIQDGEPKGVCMTNDQKINENNASGIKETWEKFKDIPGAPVNTTSHAILNVYYETIGGGGLLGWLGNKIGGILAAGFGFLTPDSVEEWLQKAVLSVFSKLLDILGTMVIDVMDNGPKLFNGIHAGATITYNRFCQLSLGCGLLTLAEAGEINQQIAIEREKDIAAQGWMYATFSPEVRTSVTNQLAIAMPSSLAPSNFNAGQGLTQLATLISQSPSRMFGLLTPQTNADRPYVDLYGVDPFGVTNSQAGAPLSKESMTGEECPEVAENEYDGCKMDKAVAEAMICHFTPDAPNCNFATSGASDSPPTDEPPSSTGFSWPVALADWPSRPDPIAECGLLYRDGTVHTGIDISVPAGTPILAAADGIITMSNGSYGALNIQTSIKDGAGKTIYLNYQHMSRRDVSVGTPVKRGDVIGLSGKVGTGAAHLHFGVWTTNDFLNGHVSPSSAAGRATLADMKHPMDYLPTDSRKISECKPPYAVPS